MFFVPGHHARHNHPGKYDKGNHASHGALKMLGSNSWWPRRQVVRATLATDWVPFSTTDGSANYTIGIMNTVQQPLAATPFSITDSYRGLNGLLASTFGLTGSIYKLARVLHFKIKIDVMNTTNSAANVAPIEMYLFPSNLVTTTGVPGAGSMKYAANQPYCKRCIVSTNENTMRSMSIAFNIRKYFGLTKESYGQDEYYCDAITDPASKCAWIMAYQSIGGGVAAGVYTIRAKIDAIIELSGPFDANMLDPSSEDKSPMKPVFSDLDLASNRFPGLTGPPLRSAPESKEDDDDDEDAGMAAYEAARGAVAPSGVGSAAAAASSLSAMSLSQASPGPSASARAAASSPVPRMLATLGPRKARTPQSPY